MSSFKFDNQHKYMYTALQNYPGVQFFAYFMNFASSAMGCLHVAVTINAIWVGRFPCDGHTAEQSVPGFFGHDDVLLIIYQSTTSQVLHS